MERSRHVRPALLAAFAVTTTLIAPLASAAFISSLAFTQPTGTASPTDSIPVWVRLTLDPSSDPLELNDSASASPPFGVPPENYPDFYSPDLTEEDVGGYELVSLDSLDAVYLNTSFVCSGTFTTSCTAGPPYTFSFNTSGPDTINFVPNYGSPTFSLQPGESHDYLFGTFTPTGGGPVAPGTYYFYSTDLMLSFHGTGTWKIPTETQATDEDGEPLFDPDTGEPIFYELRTTSLEGRLNLATTPCGAYSGPSCAGAFVREVSAVPAPAAFWLFGSGMGALGALRTRRRRRAG